MLLKRVEQQPRNRRSTLLTTLILTLSQILCNDQRLYSLYTQKTIFKQSQSSVRQRLCTKPFLWVHFVVESAFVRLNSSFGTISIAEII